MVLEKWEARHGTARFAVTQGRPEPEQSAAIGWAGGKGVRHGVNREEGSASWGGGGAQRESSKIAVQTPPPQPLASP